MKVYPKQSLGCSAVGVSAGAVDPKTPRKCVWAFIDAAANLGDVVVSNHSVGTARNVVFFVMMTCDSPDAPKRMSPMLARG